MQAGCGMKPYVAPTWSEGMIVYLIINSSNFASEFYLQIIKVSSKVHCCIKKKHVRETIFKYVQVHLFLNLFKCFFPIRNLMNFPYWIEDELISL